MSLKQTNGLAMNMLNSYKARATSKAQSIPPQMNYDIYMSDTVPHDAVSIFRLLINSLDHIRLKYPERFTPYVAI